MNKQNKIIRICKVISTIGNYQDVLRNSKYQIENAKKEVMELAKKLNYPDNSYTSEIFDININTIDRETPEKCIANLDEMLSRASAFGCAAKYTFYLDGCLDSNGNRIKV